MDQEQLVKTLSTFIAEQPDVRLAYLFGSQARGTAHRLSDVDVAVLLAPELSQAQMGEASIRLTGDLMGLLHGNDVDVVILNRAPLLMQHEVLRDGRLLFATADEVRARFAEDTYRRYLDCRYLYDMLDEAMFRRLREGRFGHQQISPQGTLREARREYREDKDSSGGL